MKKHEQNRESLWEKSKKIKGHFLGLESEWIWRDKAGEMDRFGHKEHSKMWKIHPDTHRSLEDFEQGIDMTRPALWKDRSKFMCKVDGGIWGQDTSGGGSYMLLMLRDTSWHLIQVSVTSVTAVSASPQGFQGSGWGDLTKEHHAVDAETSPPGEEAVTWQPLFERN